MSDCNRLNVQFTKRQLEAMDEIGAHLDRNSKGAVLKIALSLLSAVCRERKAGNAIAFVKDGKIVKEITGMFGD